MVLLIGQLLGDGPLLINKKGVNGLPKPTANANFVMTLKKQRGYLSFMIKYLFFYFY